MTENGIDLKRVLDLKDTLALSFGAMVGWSWVILSGMWISNGGSLGAVGGFVLAGLPIMLIGLLYAELASAMPVAGGEHEYSLRALGRTGSFYCTWAIVFVYVSVCAFEAVALPTVIEYWFPDYNTGFLYNIAGWDLYASWVAVGAAGAIVVTTINYIGVKSSAVVQTTVTLLVLAAGVMLISGALFKGDSGNLTPLFGNGMTGVLAVAVMAPFMFVGFDVIPQAAQEINLPARLIGKVLVGSIAMALGWYSLVILSVSLLLPATGMGDGLVTADAARNAWGPVGANLLVLGGIGGIISSWNAFKCDPGHRCGLHPGAFPRPGFPGLDRRCRQLCCGHRLHPRRHLLPGAAPKRARYGAPLPPEEWPADRMAGLAGQHWPVSFISARKSGGTRLPHRVGPGAVVVSYWGRDISREVSLRNRGSMRPCNTRTITTKSVLSTK